MDFTTQVEVAKHKNEIDFTSKIITLGSCFSDSIGDKFKYYQFSVLPNPFGVIFNPKSIEILVQRAATSRFFTEADLIAEVLKQEAAGITRKDAIAEVARITGRAKREVFDAMVTHKSQDRVTP